MKRVVWVAMAVVVLLILCAATQERPSINRTEPEITTYRMQDPEAWDVDEYEREAEEVTLRDLHLFLNPLVS